jgi:GT2 family glycosyltransferase
LAEDRDFSYRAQKHGKVLLNPKAEMIHKVVNIARLPTEKKTRMTYVHQMYLISKNLGWTFKTSFCYWWNIFGRLLIKTISLIKLKKEFLKDFKNNWTSFFYVLRQKRKIVNLNIEDFNKWLLEKR